MSNYSAQPRLAPSHTCFATAVRLHAPLLLDFPLHQSRPFSPYHRSVSCWTQRSFPPHSHSETACIRFASLGLGHTHIHTNAHTHTLTHSRTCTHARTHARTHTHTHTHTHTRMYALTHIDTHTHTNAKGRPTHPYVCPETH